MKKIIYVILILIVILGGSLFLVNNAKTQKPKDNNEANNQTEIIHEENNVNLKEVDNTAMYFTIESCIENYMKYISKQDENAIYGILDQEYIKENGINSSNVLNFVINNKEKKPLDFDIQKMLVENDEEDVQKYYVYGIVRNTDGRTEKSYLTINIDINALVYSVIPNVPKGVFNEGK